MVNPYPVPIRDSTSNAMYNQESAMTPRRLAQWALSLMLASAILQGCREPGSDPTSPTPHFKRGGGANKDRSVLVTITGGLVTGPNLTVVAEDNGRRTLIDDIGGADLQLTLTQAAAIDEITNPANPICEFRGADGSLADKQATIASLMGPRLRGSVAVNKRDHRGSVGYNSTESGGPWLTLGINTQTGQIEDRAAIDFLGTDPDDPTALRKYRFVAGTGIWRTFVDGTGFDLICTNQDEFVVVVDPNVP